jgi:Chaperone of endosialidase
MKARARLLLPIMNRQLPNRPMIPIHRYHPYPMAAFAALLLILLRPAAGYAQVLPSANPPGQLTFQGFVTDANGFPLATNAPKNYDIEFRIYAASTGNGGAVWGELQTVTVDRGYFSTLLGQGVALSSGEPWSASLASVFTGANASDRYIGMTVRNVTPVNEIQPRLRLLASPYSFLAANANALVGNTGQVVVASYNNYVGIDKTNNPASELDVNGTVSALLFNGNGAGLSNVNAAAITSGNLPNSALSADVALLDQNQTFTSTPAFANGFVANGNPSFRGNPSFFQSANFQRGAGVYRGQSLQFGVDDTHKGSNAGLIGEEIFSPDSLDITGVGDITAHRRIKLYADSGVSTYGPIGVQTRDKDPVAALQVMGSGWFGLDSGGLPGVAGKGVRMFYESSAFDAGQIFAYDYGAAAPKPLLLQQPGGGVSINTSTLPDGALNLGGSVRLNDNPIYFRGAAGTGPDVNHWLGYTKSFPLGVINIGVDGPALVGFGGGVLGTSNPSFQFALLWGNNGNVTVRGSLSQNCDRNVKDHFESVDPKQVLDKVSSLPITEWNYKSDPASKHIGPMAQDFYAAFTLGEDERHITTVDEGGVALAAIKGLNEVVREKEDEIQSLKREMKELRSMVEALAKARAPREP